MDGDRECAAFEGPTGKVLEHSDSEGGLSKTDSACLALMNDVSRHTNDTVSNHNLETEQSSVANESSIKEDNIETNSCNDFQRERNNGDEIESIYLDDGSHVKKPATVNKPQRKLTKAQLAAMEALASFGGSELGSISVKRRDLRDELKKETELLTSQDIAPEDTTKRHRTRLQAAKQETAAIFRHIPLGESIKKKVPSTFRRKRARDEEEGFEMKRLSSMDKAKAEALEAFGGASFESLSKRQRINQDNVGGLKKQPDPQRPTNRLTRAERAQLEALKSFGGSGLGEVMDGSKRRIARSLEVKSKQDDQSENSDTNKDDEVLQQQSDKENLVNQITT